MRTTTMKNFEKVKKMNIKELARFLAYSNCKICSFRHENCSELDCANGIKKWLESEVKSGK